MTWRTNEIDNSQLYRELHPEPQQNVHQTYQGEWEYRWHQGCGCDRCRQIYAQHVAAQANPEGQSK
jgi:hypothetical protein